MAAMRVHLLTATAGRGGDRVRVRVRRPSSSSNINEIQGGISEKAGIVVRFVSMFCAAMAIGFAYSWQLALVILAVVPLVAASGAAMGRVISAYSERGQEAYAKAGGVADEVLGNVRTVVAFGAEDRATELYKAQLQDALFTGIKKAHFAGIGIGYGRARTRTRACSSIKQACPGVAWRWRHMEKRRRRAVSRTFCCLRRTRWRSGTARSW